MQEATDHSTVAAVESDGLAAAAHRAAAWAGEPFLREDEDAEGFVDEDGESEEPAKPKDPGAVRRFRFRHPTASGKTIAAGGFVEAARTMGILILTHRRLLVQQFTRDLTTEGYGDRFWPA